MKNRVQPGHVLTFTAAGPIKSGDGVAMGALFGVAATDAGTGEEFEAAVVGVYRLPKADDDIGPGDRLYWDAAEGEVTTDDDTGANRPIGAATEAAGPSAATVAVRLDGVAV